MIKAVIFDYGGVIGNNVMPAIYTETSKAANTDYETARAEFHRLSDLSLKGEISSIDFWKSYAKGLKMDAKLLEKTWEDTYVKHSKNDERVISIIKSLKQKGYRLALLSNAIDFFAPHRKEKVIGLFDIVIFSCDVKMRKPDREIYDFLLKKLELEPAECVFIDDLKRNTDGAEAVGIKSIVFKTVEQMIDGLKLVGVELE